MPRPGMTRIGLDVPLEWVRRLDVQATVMEYGGAGGRAALLQDLAEPMLREWEQIDAEEGRPCTCGTKRPDVQPHANDCCYMPKPEEPA